RRRAAAAEQRATAATEHPDAAAVACVAAAPPGRSGCPGAAATIDRHTATAVGCPGRDCAAAERRRPAVTGCPTDRPLIPGTALVVARDSFRCPRVSRPQGLVERGGVLRPPPRLWRQSGHMPCETAEGSTLSVSAGSQRPGSWGSFHLPHQAQISTGLGSS